MAHYVPFRLPERMALGVSTAPTQIEGGDSNNSWFEWSMQPGRIVDATSTLRANDHWNRFEADIDLMVSLGIRHYRLGIEWSRIEPEQGRFDEAAVERYRQELALLRERGIEPLVTLHHFSNPLWFERMGAFTKRANLRHFLDYVAYIVERIQDLCRQFVTINEPNVYAVLGYFFGIWPPGHRSVRTAIRVMRNMAFCHIEAYRIIHRICDGPADADRPGAAGGQAVKAGFAYHMRIMVPYSANPVNRLGASLLSWIFQGMLLRAAMSGRFALPIGLGAPLGRGRYYDFIGLNYYTRNAVKGFKEVLKPGSVTNALGWDIYPDGIRELSGRLHQMFNAPVWITENGTCETEDRRRIDYIYRHLKALSESPAPVERYYHWTFIDNFEWAEGEQAPFGLVALDFETQARTVRDSGRFYRELIENHGVTQDMIDRYLSAQDQPPAEPGGKTPHPPDRHEVRHAPPHGATPMK